RPTVEVALGEVLLDRAAGRLAVDLLAAIDAAQRRGPIALLEVAAVLHPLAALPDVGALATLPQVGALPALANVGSLSALADVGTLSLANAGTALRAVGDLAAELLALLGAGPVLAELLARRLIAIGDAAAMAGIVLPTVVVGVAATVEVPVDVGRPVGIDVDVGVAASPVPAA